MLTTDSIYLSIKNVPFLLTDSITLLTIHPKDVFTVHRLSVWNQSMFFWPSVPTYGHLNFLLHPIYGAMDDSHFSLDPGPDRMANQQDIC
jgi:hypothetical protein